MQQTVTVATKLPTGNERVLFVDDSECIAYTSEELLTCLGYKVTCVTSSTEALEIFKAASEEFDLIFTAQTMLEMSGIELAFELLEIRPDIPIILCSDLIDHFFDLNRGFGFRERCMRPMNMEQLATVARKVLDERGKES